MQVSWSQLKDIAENKKSKLQMVEEENQYVISLVDSIYIITSYIQKTSPRNSDQIDFEDNYKADSNAKISDTDGLGRSIVRTAMTRKGWHYQAHSVQFEVNKLNSIYNKDREGNDLGYASMEVYDASGNKLTTQTDVDTDGVKTVVTWAPDFDLEVVAGNIRQASNESVNSYLYVDAVIPTGLAAPNDRAYIPFTTGGINLNYIGADETLKTDGRASKLIPCSQGAKFEIVLNYDSGVLNNENRHKMSLIFEIYKAV